MTKSESLREANPFDLVKKEEAPTNAAGGGAIHGIGVGPHGEPGVHKKAAKKYKKKQDDVEKGRKVEVGKKV